MTSLIHSQTHRSPTVRGFAGNANFRDLILADVSVIAPTAVIAIPENSTVYPDSYRHNLLFTAWNDGRIRRLILSGPDLTLLGPRASPTTAARAVCSV
ncbi:hypothetical protein AYO43_06220 [Nitrospira sp. SCGC AG-212-E16]|nr:hypothetical protein AYO43_06220 [Nitrospira sp. SCGC AG-212-E16]